MVVALALVELISADDLVFAAVFVLVFVVTLEDAAGTTMGQRDKCIYHHQLL